MLIIFDRFVVAFILLVVLFGIALLANPLEYGLSVTYYNNPDSQGDPVLSLQSRSIDKIGIDRVLPSIQFDYSIICTGTLLIEENGEYAFAAVSDDGSEIHLDGQLLVDNSGFHGKRERSQKITLQKGFHPIKIRYVQYRGISLLRLYWTPPGSQRQSLSKAKLFSKIPTKKELFVGRLLENFAWVIKFLFRIFLVALVVFLYIKRHVIHTFWKELELPRPGWLALIFLIVFFIHFFMSPYRTVYDSRWEVHTALSLLREGNFDLDEYHSLVQGQDYFQSVKRNDHVYPLLPMGTSLLSIPVVFVLDQFFEKSIDMDLEYFLKVKIPAGIQVFIASIFVSLTSVMIYLVVSLYFKDWRYATFWTYVFACCTSAWSTASRALWQHGPSMLVLSIILYCLLIAKEHPRYAGWSIRLVSFLLAFSFLIRPTNIVSILIITLYVLLIHRKHFRAYCLWSLPVALPFFITNILIFDLLLPFYYNSKQLSFTPDYFQALAGNLVSPSRGLFIFSPVFLFVIYGLWRQIKARQMSVLDYALLVILIMHWLVVSAHVRWWGGYSFGPRYFTDVLPYLMYFLIKIGPIFSRLSGFRNIIFISLFIGSILSSTFIHYQGASSHAVYDWNALPVSIDDKPERAWDWRDPQFLRGLYTNFDEQENDP